MDDYTSPTDKLTVERDRGMLRLALARPEKRNPIDAEMVEVLTTLLQRADLDPDIRAVVLTAEGDFFCSGADLRDPVALKDGALLYTRRAGHLVTLLAELSKPTVAAVPGPAFGYGSSLALACDLVFAASTASFAFSFADRGLTLDGGASWFLPRLVGLRMAKELALSGEAIGAADAAARGLITRVVPADELTKQTTTVAERWANGPTVALSLAKRLLQEGSNRTLAEAVEDEARAQALAYATKDAKEAITAFLEKRPPTFTGR